MFNNRDSKIFQDELYLSPQYTPPEPIAREKELKEISKTVDRIRSSKNFETLLIHGSAGIGKTTCIEHVLNHFSKRTTLKQVKINCWQYNTRSALLTELLIQLGYPAPRKGKPIDELLSKLQEWLDKNRDIVIWLDEYDQLDDKTEIAYDLFMTSSEAKQSIGVIMVSNQPPNQLEIKPRSNSRLNYRILELEPYTKEELIEILEIRVEKAFKPGTVPQESIELIASHVSKIGGDCRRTFDLLLRAGQRAEEEQVGEVTPRIVELEISGDWN